MNSLSDRTCRIVRINIVRIKVCIKSNRKNNRKEISLKKILKYLRIYLFDISYVADIFAFGKFLMALEKAAVFSADADCLYTERFYQCDKFFVYFCKNHLSNLHCVLICHTQPIDKTWFHADFIDPAADFLATAVNDDRFESDQLQKNNVLDDIRFEFFVQHGTPTVFYNYDLTVKALYIRKGLDKCFCFIQIFLIYHFSFLLDFYSFSPFMICNLH